MRKRVILMMTLLTLTMLLIGFSTVALAQNECVSCHKKETPGIYKDWKAGKMGQAGITCDKCHGTKHENSTDYKEVKMPNAETCATCHPERNKQFQAGKHSKAWVAFQAMPKTKAQPDAVMKKGCASCHKIGKDGGKCDSCHTRHSFSVKEAKKPKACATCHMGPDHPQYEMWSKSKHGVIYQIEGDTGRAPTCQTCHMDEGDHEVKTAWGFLGLRLPEPNEEWAADRGKILQGMGVLEEAPKLKEGRLNVVKAGDVMRLTMKEWKKERKEMINICSDCHSTRFAKEQLQAGDQIIREADRLIADAIEIVEGLYKDGVIEKPDNYPAFPDLLKFYDAKTPIEQKLYKMWMFHKHKAFQGAFHSNPDYSHWYGWAKLKEDLVEIEDMAKQMRLNHKMEEKLEE